MWEGDNDKTVLQRKVEISFLNAWTKRTKKSECWACGEELEP